MLNWGFVESSWERELLQALQKVDQTDCELDENGEKMISELSLCEWSKTNRTSRSMTEKNYCQKSSVQSVPRQNLSEIWLETQFGEVRGILEMVEVRLRESWPWLNYRSLVWRSTDKSDSEKSEIPRRVNGHFPHEPHWNPVQNLWREWEFWRIWA